MNVVYAKYTKFCHENGYIPMTERQMRRFKEFQVTSSDGDFIPTSNKWIESRYKIGDTKISCHDLYNNYCDWCKTTNKKPVNQNLFSRNLVASIGKSKSIRLGGKIVKGYCLDRI